MIWLSNNLCTWSQDFKIPFSLVVLFHQTSIALFILNSLIFPQVKWFYKESSSSVKIYLKISLIELACSSCKKLNIPRWLTGIKDLKFIFHTALTSFRTGVLKFKCSIQKSKLTMLTYISSHTKNKLLSYIPSMHPLRACCH